MDRVTFTPRSAQRIANAVLIVEAGDKKARGINFRMPPGGGDEEVFRVCTFTGAWSIGNNKDVTLKNAPETGTLVPAMNLFWPLGHIDNADPRDACIARDGSAWYLVTPLMDVSTALHSVSLGDALTFDRIQVIHMGTASTVSVSTITCTT